MFPHGIMFHHFRNHRHPRGQGSMSADELAAMIDHLGRRRILPAVEWMERLERGRLGDEDLCLTFDDNLRCQYDVALPVLRDRGLTGFWFVSTCVLEGEMEHLQLHRRFCDAHFADVETFYGAFFQTLAESPYNGEVQEALAGADVEAHLGEFSFYTNVDRRFRYVRDVILGRDRYREIVRTMMRARCVEQEDLAADLWMDAHCLKALHADGHIIGLHSHTHPPRLADLDATTQEREYRDNRQCLTRLLGEHPRSMSHPCNSYNEGTLNVLRELGVVLGFRANMVRERAGALECPREDHTNILVRMRR